MNVNTTQIPNDERKDSNMTIKSDRKTSRGRHVRRDARNIVSPVATRNEGIAQKGLFGRAIEAGTAANRVLPRA